MLRSEISVSKNVVNVSGECDSGVSKSIIPVYQFMDIQKVNEKLSVETIDKPSFSDKGVLERIEKKIMPPPFAAFQPTDQEREEISYKGVEGIEKMKRNEIE